jgi:hypothetical protein
MGVYFSQIFLLDPYFYMDWVGESVAEWSRSRTRNSDVVGSRPGAACDILTVHPN